MDHNPCDSPQPQPPEEPSPLPTIRVLGDFQRWLVPNDTPFITSLPKGRAFGAEPDYCKQHLSEPVEPEHTLWQQAQDLLHAVTPDEDEDYWEPSPRWYDLSRIVAGLRKVAFRQIPNPEYDEDRCAEWRRENRRGPVNQTKVEWGMSNLVNEKKFDLEEKILKGE